MNKFLAALGLLMSKTVFACPFCDNGGEDTALFIGSIFGLFAVSMFFLFLFAYKRGLLRNSNQAADIALKAESWEENQNER